EQNKLLSDKLLEVYHDSQELHEKIQNQNYTISLLREHEEELLQGLALLKDLVVNLLDWAGNCS
ncbi:11792_t:CDS:2, partial [Funneliformis geosporum]